MEYRLKYANNPYLESRKGGKIYEDDNRYYQVYLNADETPDNTTWASLTNNYECERDMPIFTIEYCKYQGITRKEYDTITIID